jgi:hypothetical protein
MDCWYRKVGRNGLRWACQCQLPAGCTGTPFTQVKLCALGLMGVGVTTAGTGATASGDQLKGQAGRGQREPCLGPSLLLCSCDHSPGPRLAQLCAPRSQRCPTRLHLAVPGTTADNTAVFSTAVGRWAQKHAGSPSVQVGPAQYTLGGWSTVIRQGVVPLAACRIFCEDLASPLVPRLPHLLAGLLAPVRDGVVLRVGPCLLGHCSCST